MTPPARADVDRFRSLIMRRLGLMHDDAAQDQLADLLQRRMAAAGARDFDGYARRLAGNGSAADEVRALAEELTVGETFFFRNADDFRALELAVLPDRIRRQERARRLHVLSLGCASGEEPYSIAMLLRERMPEVASWEVQITALDVNRAALARARAGRYSAWSLRATAEERAARWFHPDGRERLLDPGIRAMVSFGELNLADEAPGPWPSLRCDVVLWRNVLMYLTPEVRQRTIERIGEALLPGGYLFLGHAETLRGLSSDFHLCHAHGTFYYQRREEGEAPAAAPPAMASRAAIEPAVAAIGAVAADTAWLEVIQRASERVTALTTPGAAPSAAAPAAASSAAAPAPLPPRRRDLDAVLELTRQERFDEALSSLHALPDESREDPDALLLRAVLLLQGGRVDEAEALCRRLLVVAELDAGAHYLMALCREQAGNLAGAIHHDRTAIYLDTGFAMPQLHLGLLSRRGGNRLAAQRALDQALILLAREDASRLLLFGGGFSRDTLVGLCRAELRALEGPA